MKNRRQTFCLFVLGLFTGFSSSALGIGGGIIVVPTLMLLVGYEIKTAIGTSLVVIVPTAFIGIGAHYIINSGNIKLIAAIYMLTGSVVGAKLGAALTKKISSKILRNSFALFLLFVGMKLTGIIKIPVEPIQTNAISYAFLIFLGFAAGAGSALFGIGGGGIMVPVLNLFFGLSIHEAVATSLTVILPTTVAGAIFHKKLDNLKTHTLKFLMPTALAGAVIGAIFANGLSGAGLKFVFGVFSILMSLRIFSYRA